MVVHSRPYKLYYLLASDMFYGFSFLCLWISSPHTHACTRSTPASHWPLQPLRRLACLPADAPPLAKSAQLVAVLQFALLGLVIGTREANQTSSNAGGLFSLSAAMSAGDVLRATSECFLAGSDVCLDRSLQTCVFLVLKVNPHHFFEQFFNRLI